MKYKGLLFALMSTILILLNGCSTIAPEDTLDVVWKHGKSSLLQRPSFSYCGVDYSLLEDGTCWIASIEDMRYLGMLLTGGTSGRAAPYKLFGLPIYGSYERAFGYFDDNSENPLVIRSNKGGIWLVSSINLSPEDEQLFGSYKVYGKGFECMITQSVPGDEFSYSDILENNIVLNREELDNTAPFCSIELYLERIPCLYCSILIYRYNSDYYAPASISSPEWKTEKYVRLSDKWQTIIRACTKECSALYPQ